MLTSLKRSFRKLALFTAALLIVLLPARANAQFGMGAGMSGMQEAITKRGVEAYARILGLDKDQHDVAMTLLEGNQTEYKAAQKKLEEGMQDIQNKVRDTSDFSLYQKEMPKLTKDFSDKAQALEKSFFGDLKSACNDTQLAKWPKVERYRRRETGMRFGFVSGAAIDLIALTQRTKAQPEVELQPLLDQYELDMDKSLVTLEKMGKEAQDDYFKGDGGAMFDMTRIEKILGRFYDVGKDMRELNREYARKLSQVMDGPSKQKFDDEVRRRTFPRVYKPAHVLKQLDTAAGLPDLDKEKKDAIATIKSTYVRDAAVANDKWAKAVEEREDKAGGTMMVFMKSAQRMQGGGGDDLNKDVNEARTARKELDSKAEKQLLALLTEDQKSKLPEAPREDPNPWADLMPQADEEGP
jgi:hypothetical protein